MKRLAFAVLACCALAGCVKTGLSDDEQSAQSEEWGQKSYEEAMIKAGREDELKAEKEKWAQSQQGQDDPQAQGQ